MTEKTRTDLTPTTPLQAVLTRHADAETCADPSGSGASA